jgi:hypothetical protein
MLLLMTFADFLESVAKDTGMHVSMAERGDSVLCIYENATMVLQLPTVQKDVPVRLPSFLRCSRRDIGKLLVTVLDLSQGNAVVERRKRSLSSASTTLN